MFPVFLAGTTNNQKATESTGEQVKRHIPGTKEHHTANEGVGEKVKPCLTLQILLCCIQPQHLKFSPSVLLSKRCKLPWCRAVAALGVFH